MTRVTIRRRDGSVLATVEAPSLREANLAGADLRLADLAGARLEGARLTGADLRDARLEGARLTGADLRDARLEGTCLDPAAPVPDATPWLLAAGLRIEDGWVYAWRTAKSAHVGATDYTTPGEYVAPWFSADAETNCHPGIYFAHIDWLAGVYPDVPLVAIRARIAETVATVGGKFRARRIEVLP